MGCNSDGSYGCNVSTSLPLLCILKANLPRPNYAPFPDANNAVYNQWSGGYINITAPYSGSPWQSQTDADNICRATFYASWRLAEFHDGWGWGFAAYGYVPPNQSFWVSFNDQPANCWNSPAPKLTNKSTSSPTSTLSSYPTTKPISKPTSSPTASPTSAPSAKPTTKPTTKPTSTSTTLFPTPTPRNGMTWSLSSHDDILAIDHVSCNGCNAYSGEASCSTSLPLLCILKANLPRPRYPYNTYDQWSGGYINITAPYSGSTWQSQNDADNICCATFGAKWRLAEFHDGWGWGFAAYGNVPSNQRFWVSINDQRANCWN